jgi:negative regulator of sigma E activity
MSNVNVISEAVQVNAVTREQISRWMDGDIAPHEVELAMATLSSDDNRYCWAEMHFVGDCIRGLEPTASGCAERIRAAIAIEPTIVAPRARVARERAALQERGLMTAMRQMGRGGRAWATAAAVAAVGFVGTVVYQEQARTSAVAANDVAAPVVNVASADGAIRTGSSMKGNGNGAVATTVARNAEFDALLQAHQESADFTSLSSVRQYLRPAVVLQPQ